MLLAILGDIKEFYNFFCLLYYGGILFQMIHVVDDSISVLYVMFYYVV